MIRKKKGYTDWFNLIILIWIIISDVFLNVFCLKDLKIFVPEAVIMGNAATLSCQYDLEQATLYSVRWYFEAEEFYRYVPKESPPYQTFDVSGISVDLSTSDATSVTLKSVTREFTGEYCCEVSADAPSFHTIIRRSLMQVVELPKSEPIIRIDKPIFTIVDNFKATCTVGNSYPPANITWYLNGRKVYRNSSQRIVYRAFEGSGTISTLEVFPNSQIIQDIYQSTIPTYSPNIEIICEVSILHVYHKSVHVKIILLTSSTTTISPNLLGLEGMKNKGDPDNSPLTGNGNKIIITHTNSINLYLLIILYNIFYL